MLALIVTLAVIGLLTVLLWRRPTFGLYMLAAALPFERIGGFDLSLGEIEITVRASQLIGAALIIIAAERLINKQKTINDKRFGPHSQAPSSQLPAPISLEKWEWLPGLYLVAGLFSLTAAESLVRGLLVAGFTAFVWLLFLTVRRMAKGARWQVIERALWWTTLLTILFGFYQFVGDLAGLPIQWTGLREAYTKSVFGFPRIQSFALEPLYLANFLLIPFALFLSLLLRRHDWRSILMVFLLSVTLTLTLSRGGYAAGIVVLITVLAGLWQIRGALILLGVGTVAVGVLAGGALISGASLGEYGDLSKVETFSQQATNIETGASVTERGESRRLALEAFKEKPLTGIGIGNFGRWASERSPDKFIDESIVNNEPLELLAETGIAGFLAILAFVIVLLVRSWRAYRSKADEYDRVWLVALTAVLLGFIVQYQTFSTLYVTHIWVTLGLLAAVQSSIIKKQKAKSRKQEAR